MNGDIQTVAHARFYRLRLVWKALRWVALAVYWLLAAILCLNGIALIAVNIAMIILPVVGWYHGEAWGDGAMHPLFVSAIAASVLISVIGLDYLCGKAKRKVSSRLGTKAPTVEKRPTRLAA